MIRFPTGNEAAVARSTTSHPYKVYRVRGSKKQRRLTINMRITACAAIVVTGRVAVLLALWAASLLHRLQAGRPATLAGVVPRVEWANPHMYSCVLVRNNEGKPVR
jgi:hypothetical protein